MMNYKFITAVQANSPETKKVWYDKFGLNLPPIWMGTILSTVLKKIGYQEKFYLLVCISQIRVLVDQIFLCFSWNHVICDELAHKIKTTCQISLKFCQNIPKKQSYYKFQLQNNLKCLYKSLKILISAKIQQKIAIFVHQVGSM